MTHDARSDGALSVLRAASPPMDVPEGGLVGRFLDALDVSPDEPYLDFVAHGRDGPARTEHFSRMELARAVRGALDLLDEAGVGPGDAVGLMLRSSPEVVALYLAGLARGARVVPLDVQATLRELAHPVRMARPAVLLVRPEQAALARALVGEVGAGSVREVPVGSAREWARTRPALVRDDLVTTASDDVAVVVFTSGTTTARPKGVMLTHRNLYLAPAGFADALGVLPTDRVLVVTPVHHVNALQYGIGATLTHGASLCLVDRFSASAFWATVRDLRPTVLWTMGGILSILLAGPESAEEQSARGSLRAVFAAAVGPRYREVERRIAPLVMDCYGLTEFSGGTWTLPGHNGADDSLGQSVGLPLPHLTLQVVDESGRPLPRGVVGEVVAVVEHGNVMRGYLDEPALTAQVLRDGLLWSGDLGFVGPVDGQLHFTGRRKDMIKRGGVNISSAEVESVLLTHPAVTDCAVVAAPDDVLGEVVQAFVCLTPSVAVPDSRLPDAEELRRHCRSVLSEHKVPARVVILDDLPRTATGKVVKRVLRERASQ
jgi:acyl-CoA synthetase (AMP-forming)/AMP-acid ligase II